MDSGNSGSISSSGEEEYDSRSDQTVLPATFLNHPPTHFGSMMSHTQSSLVSSHHHQTQHHNPSMFDISSRYFHAFPQNYNPHSLLNLDAGSSQGQRSEPNCTDPASQSLLGPQVISHHDDPSLRSVHDDNARLLSAPTNSNVARNSKKRTRASRRAPTTVLTTDTTNFRSMVQEFTGIPAPPFSGSSYSRRLDLLGSPSSMRSSVSNLETSGGGGGFYPLRPSPQKVNPNNPLLLSSSSTSTSRLFHNNMIDAIASTTNVSSSYQLPHPDLGLPYHQPQNIMLSMQNHPILGFQHQPSLHTPFNTLPAGFGAKSQQASLSMTSLEDLGVNAHMVAAAGLSVPQGHEHVASEGMPMRSANDDGCGDGSSARGGRRDDV